MTLPPARMEYADRKARERCVSRWGVIEKLIADAEERETEALMVAGSKALAHENRELAEEGMQSFWQVIKNDPAWPDAPERQCAAS